MSDIQPGDIPPALRLTVLQWEIISAMLDGSGRPDEEWRTGEIGKAIGASPRHVKNYLGPRLMALHKRGFLNRRMVGRVAMWSLGPMVDALKEHGIID